MCCVQFSHLERRDDRLRFFLSAQFYDHVDERDEVLVGTIILKYEILPAAVCVPVSPAPITSGGELDEWLPPLSLSYPLDCNCFEECPTVCLTDLQLRQEIEFDDFENDSLADLIDEDDLAELDLDWSQFPSLP